MNFRRVFNEFSGQAVESSKKELLTLKPLLQKVTDETKKYEEGVLIHTKVKKAENSQKIHRKLTENSKKTGGKVRRERRQKIHGKLVERMEF